jgi:hypothetical protein
MTAYFLKYDNVYTKNNFVGVFQEKKRAERALAELKGGFTFFHKLSKDIGEDVLEKEELPYFYISEQNVDFANDTLPIFRMNFFYDVETPEKLWLDVYDWEVMLPGKYDHSISTSTCGGFRCGEFWGSSFQECYDRAVELMKEDVEKGSGKLNEV